jgi:hypothetical protein
MSVCDLKNDDYYKLIAAEIPFSLDTKPRLRVYKGTQIVNEQGLPGIPSSVQSLYIAESQPKMPSIFLLRFYVFHFISNDSPISSHCRIRRTFNLVLSKHETLLQIYRAESDD